MVPSEIVVSSLVVRVALFLAKCIDGIDENWFVFPSSLKYADRIEISSRFAKMLETTKANEVPNSSNVNCIFDTNN